MLLNRTSAIATLLIFALNRGACSAQREPPDDPKLRKLIGQLEPLHKRLGEPQPGDWLDQHKEAGQTFTEYLQCKPVTPQGKRRVLYIQPLGNFTDSQRKIVTLTADFLERYYQRPVKVRDDLPLSIIPASARRQHPSWGMDQILSTHVLDKVMKPRLPPDAAAMIAFTASDLWPGEGWNFVFGQASLENRVGVWSIYRNGNPDKGPEEYRLCLRRTLKVAAHESGHMFSIPHCTAYECCMCGGNSLEESDRQPLEVCPECCAKICWATKCDPKKRFAELAEFFREQKLEAEEKFYRDSIEAVM